jgi:hypothetical protein
VLVCVCYSNTFRPLNNRITVFITNTTQPEVSLHEYCSTGEDLWVKACRKYRALSLFHLFHGHLRVYSAIMALLASKSQYVPQPHTGSHFQSSATPAAMFSQPSPTNSEFSDGPGHSDDVR